MNREVLEQWKIPNELTYNQLGKLAKIRGAEVDFLFIRRHFFGQKK